MEERFFIGAATAAHQVEGNNIHSDNWVMENLRHSDFNEPSGVAVDHYNRYEEDIRLLAGAGKDRARGRNIQRSGDRALPQCASLLPRERHHPDRDASSLLQPRVAHPEGRLDQ